MTPEEISILERLLEISKSIYTLYEKLSNLEAIGKKDSDEYKNTYNVLQIALECEDKLIKQLSPDKPKVDLYMKYLTSSYLDDKDYECYERMIIGENYVPIDIYRAYNIVANNWLTNYCTDFNIIKTIGLNKAYASDLFNLFLYYLNEEINNDENKDIVNDLEMAKYRLAYLKILSEKEALDPKKKLEININRFLKTFKDNNSRLILERIGAGSKESYIKSHLRKTIEVDNDMYENDTIRAQEIIRMCFVKAALLVVPNEEYKEVKQLIEEIIDELTKLPSKTKIANLLDASLKQVEQDKTKIIIK